MLKMFCVNFQIFQALSSWSANRLLIFTCDFPQTKDKKCLKSCLGKTTQTIWLQSIYSFPKTLVQLKNKKLAYIQPIDTKDKAQIENFKVKFFMLFHCESSWSRHTQYSVFLLCFSIRGTSWGDIRKAKTNVNELGQKLSRHNQFVLCIFINEFLCTTVKYTACSESLFSLCNKKNADKLALKNRTFMSNTALESLNPNLSNDI